MGCCADQLGERHAAAGPSGAPAAILEIADATAPQRIAFSGGCSHIGTDRPEIAQDGEGPKRWVTLAPFAAEAVPVTNARFAAFVAATGYVTEAERFGWAPVFRPLLADPDGVPASSTTTPWWGKGDGAAWFAPEGPGSHVLDRADHPVVHISWADAAAFAAWSGGRIPSEAEWEHAARGGLSDPRFPWGDREPDDEAFLPCNIWQGRFPGKNTRADGWMATSPVRGFAPNGAGLYDAAGNVWEWTADAFKVHSPSRTAIARNKQAATLNEKVMKGGSFLCHSSYCYRYRIAARSGVAADSGASNTGVRVFYGGR
jgi:formylglycine-generating enzyme required for sulfatase activity